MSQASSRPQFPQPENQDPLPEDESSRSGEMPAWLDKGTPWIASALFHLGLLVLFFFALEAINAVVTRRAHPIIVPQSWAQHFSTHPGGNPNSGPNHNPLQKTRQNIKHILSHYASTSQTSVSAVLNSSATKALSFIAVGPQGGSSGGPLASFGVPGGGMGSGPPSSFIGRGGNATRIIYIIDHSGLMLYNFEFVARELRKSVGRMVPIQRFSVILVSRQAHSLGRLALVHATMPAKKLFENQFSKVQPAGAARGRLAVYENAFRLAFKLHPQIIYFVTNGGFDPSLARIVKKMDTHGTHVFTYTFLNGKSRQFVAQLKLYSGALKKIAKETGGQYRLIKE